MMDGMLTGLGVVAFVIAAWLVGSVVNRIRHRRFSRAWRPLIDVIDGTVHEDPQGGAATSWLVGSWKGHVIHASMSPHVRSTEWQHHENRFSVRVADQGGIASWRAELSPATFARLVVHCDDPGLAQRLERAGVEALMRDAQCTVAHFDRHGGYVSIDENVSPAWIPPRERFICLLHVATALAGLQASINGGSRGESTCGLRDRA